MQPSACPYCQTTMRNTYARGLTRDECGACGAGWFDAELLGKVVTGPVMDAVFEQAKGKPGRCRGCEASLQYVPGCPSCGSRAPTCPGCGGAPLPAVELKGLPVDVCGKCRGVAMGREEVARLQQPTAPQPRPPEEPAPEIQAADFEHEYVPAPPSMSLRPRVMLGDEPACTTCGRRLEPRYGFVWEERLFCGSCAPEGSVPYSDELTKARPSESSGRRAQYLNTGATESAVVWLLSKLFK
ncbi:zf-TFIIB domain-containing protein [Corallococcus sp. ZKHCc1 1396]|uniref:Zf-TFIIB domain-containing protein n=1 Tax=Corallococcus soli TaxID=2710757 RepID=A0ABR9PXW4_9BACT|nr:MULTISPECIES: zf-TFIIB domain-containing protein [Corallococcus]MBE4752785.1 zf-TFIIB domain-containing protein [Corallococcus soli]MCY1033668.1 zf-TFIIB domain-containing protein [Corallococcus sp. BB11-1]